jgi:transcription elongation factor Elf1
MAGAVKEPGYYDCPRCDGGSATFTGRDTQKKAVYTCSKCGATFGEYALEAAARKRRTQD